MCLANKMDNKSKSINDNTHDLIEEYNEIMKFSETSVIITFEWAKEGDYFHKLSMYDENYTPVPTLNGTTLINTI